MDQEALKGHVKTSKTFIRVLSSSGFESVPNRNFLISFETEFIAAARELLPEHGLKDTFIDGVEPDDESREKILQAIALLCSGKLLLPMPSTNNQPKSEKKISGR